MNEKILITSALLYANGPRSAFGHIAGAYLPADCYARFQRLMKNDVLFISGSDEYGIAITLRAELEGRTPEEQVNLYHEINKNFFNSSISLSTTTLEQPGKGMCCRCSNFLRIFLANGHIEERVTDQLYTSNLKANSWLTAMWWVPAHLAALLKRAGMSAPIVEPPTMQPISKIRAPK